MEEMEKEINKEEENDVNNLESNEQMEGPPEEEEQTQQEHQQQTVDEIEELKQKLQQKEAEAQEYLDIAQRLKAEFENYRKRTEKEKSEMVEYGKEIVILELLPVMDNFERALASSGDYNSLKEGIELIYRQFKKMLDKFGVKEIEAEGQIFDPYKHHAVMQEEVEGKQPNEIIEVFQKGYYLKDKVIRPSLVKVAK
ncbi:nucleotide exchange factor GrpE [Thermoanaerobacter sp. CM-CNRG TB177]|uniref:Protein GrpE n=3 Tax=Thermoanaerobacteraceae TaxID=186814 RepID=B0KA82_THEP3|nr:MULTISPECIES: nucleotide exchange factor GrpE [Thermoanaerobacter]KUJ90742.1 MAG: heat shock protein GrpE [Thermoanaerobacter thermocopriae]MBT1280448.1 nucleotide exchange factor GrpE [Thermoanaerobacter sp. CM-CNRG TB177]ABY95045.1 GrpE protein [Thermoanaerobacter pseudethanolicus ATCC 33223]ADV79998.1 GrpE protein [Thermoanaerobacter brockii subsp. finnii Ako-1]HAA80993.1 nucleotide exchange factor GrpE [Thermoanaerobacter sp.]